MQSSDDKTHTKPSCDPPSRRRWLVAAGLGLAGLSGAPSLRAQAGPLRLACDLDVQAAGVASALLRGFGRDTGLAVSLQPGHAREVLDWTESGRCDAVLGASPELAAPFVDQGLLHARRTLAVLRWVLVGPLAPAAGPGAALPAGGSRRPAASAAARSTDVLASLQAMAEEPEDRRLFLHPSRPAAGRLLADALWAQAGLGPDLPWRTAARRDDALAAEARERQAFALAGAWEATAWTGAAQTPSAARPAWGLIVDHDPRLRRPVEVMRSFRSQHPAGRLFVDWISGPAGRRAIGRLPGVLPPSA